MASEDYDYVESYDLLLECCICRMPLVSPVMSSFCEHLFCRDCIVQALDTSLTCPIDRSPLNTSMLAPAPRIVQQMVAELLVLCPNASKAGCSHTCQRALLSSHLREECPGRVAPKKGKQLRKSGRDLPAVVPCTLCAQMVPPSDLATHASACRRTAVACEYCAATVQRSDMPFHLRTTCPLVNIPCPHATFGCEYRGPRSLMEEEHVLLTCAFEPLKEFLHRYEERAEMAERERDGLQATVQGMQTELREMRREMRDFKFSLGDYFRPKPRRTRRAPAPRPSTRELAASQTDGEASASGDGDNGGDVDDRVETASFFSARSSLTYIPPRAAAYAASSPVHAAPFISPRSSSLSAAEMAHAEAAAPSPLISQISQSGEGLTAMPLEAEPDRVASTSAATMDDFPPPVAAPADFMQTLASAASTSNGSSPLSAELAAITNAISTLYTSISSVDQRQGLALMKETLRLESEAQSLRGVVHGVRMQTHYILMELSRLTNSAVKVPPPPPQGGTSPTGMPVAGPSRQTADDSAESNSDDDAAQALSGLHVGGGRYRPHGGSYFGGVGGGIGYSHHPQARQAGMGMFGGGLPPVGSPFPMYHNSPPGFPGGMFAPMGGSRMFPPQETKL